MFRNTPLILWIPLPFGPSHSSLYPFVFFALSHPVYSTALLSSPQFLSQTGLAVSIPSFPAHLFPATFTGFVQDEALSAFMHAARVPFFPRASLASIFTIDKAASLILRFPIRSELAGFSAFPLDVLIHFLIFFPLHLSSISLLLYFLLFYWLISSISAEALGSASWKDKISKIVVTREQRSVLALPLPSQGSCRFWWGLPSSPGWTDQITSAKV